REVHARLDRGTARPARALLPVQSRHRRARRPAAADLRFRRRDPRADGSRAAARATRRHRAGSPGGVMSDLGDLYQQVILDHNRNPRNFKRLDAANRRAEGNNPLCGDRIQLYVQLDGDTINDIGFQMPQGSGCAISKASASLMTDAVKGKPVKDAETMFEAFRDMLAG